MLMIVKNVVDYIMKFKKKHLITVIRFFLTDFTSFCLRFIKLQQKDLTVPRSKFLILNGKCELTIDQGHTSQLLFKNNKQSL